MLVARYGTGGLVFSLDTNGSRLFESSVDDVFNFGLVGDIIVTGAWVLPYRKLGLKPITGAILFTNAALQLACCSRLLCVQSKPSYWLEIKGSFNYYQQETPMFTRKRMLTPIILTSFFIFIGNNQGTAEAQKQKGAKTYTIKLNEQPDVGKKVVVRTQDKTAGTVVVLDADGKALKEEKINETKTVVYTETVLKKGKKRAQKYQRTYQKAVHDDGNEKKVLSYQGRTVVFELKKDKYQATVLGEPALDNEDLKSLTEAANNSRSAMDWLSAKPVRLGETWIIDAVKFQKSIAGQGDIDPNNSKIEAKLVKVFRKQGKQFGVISLRAKLSTKSLKGLKFNPPGRIIMKGTLETAIDGSTSAGTMTLSGSMLGKAQFNKGGMKFTIEMDIKMNNKKTRSLEK